MKKRIVILTGAGISAESGISTFRDSNGTWENHDIQTVATPKGWNKNPDLVTRFYNERRKQCMEVEPNDAHRYLASLEDRYDVQVITQNVDNLHERAGSTNVLHLHGNIMQAKSEATAKSKAIHDLDKWELTAEDKCEHGFRLRPNIVWFGEDVPNYPKAAAIMKTADIVVIIGTSLKVYPAAGLWEEAEVDVPKFIIDLSAKFIAVTLEFTKIIASAVDGVKKLDEYLKKISNGN